MELRGFTRLAVKIAGLFMIAISLDSLPGRLVNLVGTGLPGGIQSLLGSLAVANAALLSAPSAQWKGYWQRRAA